MLHTDLEAAIEAAYERRAAMTPETTSAEVCNAVETVLALLDAGTVRVAEKREGSWHVHEWLKKAVLLSFRVTRNTAQAAGALAFYDKVPLKYSGWDDARFARSSPRTWC
jgi:2,3,4,5-tetrahydropyridine-2-carboxylate N-succinyltransferase